MPWGPCGMVPAAVEDRAYLTRLAHRQDLDNAAEELEAKLIQLEGCQVAEH